jgi:4-amino-4-deoxy-L-arabinose transferase-like glycosyltransferase
MELVKGKFWSVAKLAMPLMIIVSFPSLSLFTLGKMLGESMLHNALAALVSAITFILVAISWNCQSEIYTYLTGESEGSK